MTEKLPTCAECDELFLEYFEGELDDGRRNMLEAHASSCARCQGLIRDVKGITEAAAGLRDLEPSRDLWKGIEARIAPEVVPIGYRRDGIHLSRRVIGLAAAALIVVSSSITYVATDGADKKPRRVVNNPNEVLARQNEIGPSPLTQVESTPAPEATTESAPEPSKAAPTLGKARHPSAGTAPVGSRSTSLATNAPLTAAEKAFAPEIMQLQQMLKQRRNQLDPSTVKVVEDNLALIDAAVKQAREALMRDPASGFLMEQLDGALQKKAELLRTVALLPSRS